MYIYNDLKNDPSILPSEEDDFTLSASSKGGNYWHDNYRFSYISDHVVESQYDPATSMLIKEMLRIGRLPGWAQSVARAGMKGRQRTARRDMGPDSGGILGKCNQLRFVLEINDKNIRFLWLNIKTLFLIYEQLITKKRIQTYHQHPVFHSVSQDHRSWGLFQSATSYFYLSGGE